MQVGEDGGIEECVCLRGEGVEIVQNAQTGTGDGPAVQEVLDSMTLCRT